MTRRALVVGAQTGTLRGVAEDARRMERVLREHGFAVDVRTEHDASRAGIVNGLDRLVRDVRPGDAVWLYYSGHGGRVPVGTDVMRAIGRPAVRDIRFLVPTDHACSTSEDFRGITAWELSLWLGSLTTRTRDVTVVLDCCHAARIVRGDEPDQPQARGLPDPRTAGIARHLAALRAAGARFDLLDPLGNPHAVRLFATTEVGYAWEGEIDGVWCGVLTDALVRGLDLIGDRPVSWTALAAAVRERVTRRFADQRPEIAGFVDRAPFSREGTAPPARRAIAVSVEGAHAVLRAGASAGICVGDTFDVVSLAASPGDDAAVLARATVESVDVIEAVATLDTGRAGCDATFDTTVDLVAYPRVQGLPLLSISYAGDCEARARLAEVPWLCVMDAADGSTIGNIVRDGSEPVISVTRRGDLWIIADDLGHLRAPIPVASAPGVPGGPVTDGLDAVLEALADLAAVAALRVRATASPGTRSTTPLITASLHRSALAGYAEPVISSGEILKAGERFELHIRSCSPSPLFIHVFELSPHGGVTRLTYDATLGLPLAPHDTHVLGASPEGPMGIVAGWPESLPPTTTRTFELVVIFAPGATDLGFLERHGRARHQVRSRYQPRDVILPPELLYPPHTELAFAALRLPYRVLPPAA